MNTETSARLFAEAQQYIPGGVNSPVRAMKGVGMPYPLFIDHARGAHIWDADGNEFVDFVSSWGPMILGWGHPDIVGSLHAQVDRGTSYGAPTELEVELARLICEAVPSIELVRMVNSGTEATMSAVRVARGFTGREKIVKFIGCYHGHSDGFLAAAGSGVLTLALPDSPGVTKGTTADTLLVEYNDVESLTALFDERGDEIAALIVEPVAGNMGVVPPAPGFLEACRETLHGLRRRTDLRRSHHRVPRRLGRGAGAVRRAARPDHAGQDHRRRPPRRRLRRPPRDHGDGGAARLDLPGGHALRQPAGDGGRRGGAARPFGAGRLRTAREARRTTSPRASRGRRRRAITRSRSTRSAR